MSSLAPRRFLPLAVWLLALTALLAAPPRVAAVMTTPPAKLASWGPDPSPSGRPNEQSPATHDRIRVNEPCAYELASGRSEWLSRDPIAEQGGINLYGYVGADPVNAIDPLGLKTCWKKMLVTNYGAYEGEVTASTGKPLGPGDMAVADTYYTWPDQRFDPGHRTPQYAYPLGTQMTVYTSNDVYVGRVADNGRGHIKTRDGKYPNGVPADSWVDLWYKNNRHVEEWAWASMEIDDCKKCPMGWSGDW